MADIVKAIEKEKEYLSYRMKGEEPFHLVDAIKECGFDSLSEYVKEKKAHDFKALGFSIVEAPTLNAIAEVVKAIATKKPAVVMVNIDRTVVFPRNDAEYDKDYCLANGIIVLPVSTAGNGALVSVSGDLGVGICIPKNKGFTYKDILDGFINIFRKYTDKSIYNEGNDIMCDGKKICGFAFFNTPNVIMAISPISLTEKSELISKICMKTQTKIPGHIDFVDRDTLRQEMFKWLQSQ